MPVIPSPKPAAPNVSARLVVLGAERIHDADGLEAFARTFARRVVDELAGEVDSLERKIREEVPVARVIDIEAD